MRLEGKIGLVTAAASGMGRAGATRFSQEGASVAIVDLDGAKAEAVAARLRADGGPKGVKVIALAGDLRDDGFAREIVARTVAEFGGLDFVWNHVGHPGPASVEGVDMAQYELAMDLNLRSVLVTTEAAIPHLRARGGGALLFTASVSGLEGSAYSPIYSMAKFGVVGFVRSLAKRLAADRIRVNAVCPGLTDTPMLRTFVARPDQARTANQNPEMVVRETVKTVPFGRAARPDEVANAALFLLSDEASYISGVALPVDGALTA